MIGTNTLLGISLFGEEIKDSFILHLPHSSIEIPSFIGFNSVDPSIIENDLLKLTDWDTDRIFNVQGITQIKADFNRIFCDVERLYPDELEPMALFGRGFFYTKSDDGLELRQDNDNIKDKIYKNYYLKYHKKFNDIVNRKLKKCGEVHIVDCHSFSNEPFNTDSDKSLPRPDICIGTDDFHTPSYLIDFIKCHFENNQYSVKINSPYSGTMIPSNFYKKNSNVKGIMVEINRRLYMEGTKIDVSRVIKLNNIIKSLFDNFN